MNILDIYNKLSQCEGLTKNTEILGTIIGGLITLPSGKIENHQLREQFNLTAMPVINSILNPLVELSPGLNVSAVIESAFKSYQLRYLTVYDFGNLLMSTVSLCSITHTTECTWASGVYDMLYEYLNSFAE